MEEGRRNRRSRRRIGEAGGREKGGRKTVGKGRGRVERTWKCRRRRGRRRKRRKKEPLAEFQVLGS